MGASDIIKSQKDTQKLREDRERRINPPEYAPGQGDVTDVFSDDVFATTFAEGDNPSFDIFSQNEAKLDALEGQFDSRLFTNNEQVGVNTQFEDKLVEGAKHVGKESYNFIKDIVGSMGNLTPKFYSVYGSRVAVVGGVVAIVGLITWLFRISQGLQMVIGGLLSAGFGIILLMFMIDVAKDLTSQYKDELSSDDELAVMSGDDTGWSYDTGLDTNEELEEGGDEEEDGDDLEIEDEVTAQKSEDTGYEWGTYEDNYPEYDTEEVINAIDSEVMRGCYTRAYLFETYQKLMDYKTPYFQQVQVIDEDSDTFLVWEDYLREAAMQTGLSEEELPELIKLEETLFAITLTISRPKGIKMVNVGEELRAIFASVKKNKQEKSAVFVDVKTVGVRGIIVVYTGEHAMVTVNDTYKLYEVSEFVLNTDNELPVVLGIDEDGEVLRADFMEVESILVTGEPRRGKSWTVVSIMAQLAMYNSPKRVQFYINDPKAGVSEYSDFDIPHVARFETTDSGIVDALRYVVNVEGPRREALLGKAGVKKIQTYWQEYPENDLPIIYVVIDELLRLASRMEKDVKKEFQGLLRSLVTSLPAVGIRLIGIPHKIRQEFIDKATSDMITCRFCVNGTPAMIQDVFGISSKEFPYKLVNKGESAFRMREISAEVLFLRGTVLMKNKDNMSKLYKNIKQIWAKLEPDSQNIARVSLGSYDKKEGEQVLDLEEMLVEEQFKAKEVDEMTEKLWWT